ncbi:hypothetical protein ACFQX4_19255 [Roseomonas sp. GCM10028921]
MPRQPFELLSCSWPVRVTHDSDGVWTSDPAWDAPPAPFRPNPAWTVGEGHGWCTIDWRSFFRRQVTDWDHSGQMRGFHVVFRLRALAGGRLVCRDDDGSIVRRGGAILRSDRHAHGPAEYDIAVEPGDLLEIAQWQLHGDWSWSARPEQGTAVLTADALVAAFLPEVRRRLAEPTGPAVKLFTDGRAPLRAVLALYSMILNGYSPSGILLFGEHQWPAGSRQIFAEALPFARVIETAALCWAIERAGGAGLSYWAMRAWWVMKACVALFTDPRECCVMDDDVVVLDRVDDALQHFATADLVYQPDLDHGERYLQAWAPHGIGGRLSTGRFNAGLYWMRNGFEARDIARRMLALPPERTWHVTWEQGLIATLFAERRHVELPSGSYFYPLLDGLPGGVLGYDYRDNPCRFRSVHFGGLSAKPGDEAAMFLARDVLRG